ncbi:CoB--CoM heterodisulfide reductase iron-sulfur subunit A family protein [Archaeoglobales archaeon]|nr:MAG: CoB--CoM heterodisulfide reductase iron-sulfur subunit A family protein [Archaeoglobales archaeon]
MSNKANANDKNIKDIKEKEEPRIGVFVCHCGTNIGGVVDVPEVTEYASKLPYVVYAERNLYTCSSDGVDSIKRAIKEHNINRVVVAACTPRTHEPLFRRACEEAGVNKYLFEFANIRDQCSWIHMYEPEKATEKAKEIVRMAVAKAALLEPQEESVINVDRTALVVGGGISGMTAALSLAKQGFDVYLVEKEKELGGLLRKHYKLFPTFIESEKVVKAVVEKVMDNEKINVLTSSQIEDVDGYIGNFKVKVKSNGNEKEIKVGTIVIAIGAEEYKPTEFYNYDGKKVITQLELEERLKGGNFDANTVVMIQCVGARGMKYSYCSKICCTNAVKNALIIKQINPKASIFILHNGINVYGEYEHLLVEARRKGIKFVKFPENKLPEVGNGNEDEDKDKVKVKVFHESIGKELLIDADLVVLSTPLIQPKDAERLSKILKVPIGSDGFFYEAHVKLRPLDFATDGVYLCGTCHGPRDVAESVAQALGAASRASIPMAKGYVVAEAITASIDQDKCVKCGMCVDKCPYGAIRMNEKVEVIEALCKGCGTCIATCPTGALDQKHFRNSQIIAQIKSVMEWW